MTLNIKLLREAVEFAEAAAARQRTYTESHPNDPDYEGWDELDPATDPKPVTWNQEQWAKPKRVVVDSLDDATLEHCGTAYCIAGFAVSQQPGYEVKFETYQLDSGKYYVAIRETLDGKTNIDHREVGRKALGLSEDEASALFFGGNDIEDVRQIAQNIAGQAL